MIDWLRDPQWGSRGLPLPPPQPYVLASQAIPSRLFKNMSIHCLQESFSNPNTKNETPAHVVSRLVSLASELGISPKFFEDGFNDVATDQATRISFKARKFYGIY